MRALVRARAPAVAAAARALSTAPPPPKPSRFAFFDKLLPEDPPELRAYKAREARLIREQVGRSKFMDAHRAAGADKLFVATGDLAAPAADALFPELELAPVAGGGGGGGAPAGALFSRARATVLTLAFQGLGQTQLAPWHAALAALPAAPARAGASPPPHGVQLLNVLFLQGWFWRAARGIVAGATAAALPPGLVRDATHTASETSARATDHFCDAARVHNKLMAHVFIVDARGHVRWRAHGAAADGEADAMAYAAAALAATPQRGEAGGA